MNWKLTKQLLLSSNYWVLNKDMVQLFGLETAFILSTFAEAESMMADKEGWFYQTSETVEKITTLSRYKQDQSIKQLEDEGILLKDVRGIPAKRYFKIDYEALANKFVRNSQTSSKETGKLDCKKTATSKESIINKIDKETTTSGGGDFSEIMETYQSNFGLVTPRIGELLIKITEDYPADWILEAMDISIINNKRNLGYIEAILKRWYADGKDDGIGSSKEKITNSWKVDAT